jgi:hypothetical protein
MINTYFIITNAVGYKEKPLWVNVDLTEINNPTLIGNKIKQEVAYLINISSLYFEIISISLVCSKPINKQYENS